MTVGVSTTNADGRRARGGSNGNQRGNAEQRRKRRQWLVATFRADVDLYDERTEEEGGAWSALFVVPALDPSGAWVVAVGTGVPACRCYRCGTLLTEDTVSADRIKPGVEGGTYARTNLRPACTPCQCTTGAQLAHTRKRARSTVGSRA